MWYIIILSLMCSVIICIISCLFQNWHLFTFCRTKRTLPGPMRLPFIGGTSSFILQKPEGNSINNNNNNNNNNKLSSARNLARVEHNNICLAFILFISTITKWFGYNINILLIARHYVLFTHAWFYGFLYMLSLRKTEYSQNVWLIDETKVFLHFN